MKALSTETLTLEQRLKTQDSVTLYYMNECKKWKKENGMFFDSYFRLLMTSIRIAASIYAERELNKKGVDISPVLLQQTKRQIVNEFKHAYLLSLTFFF